MTESDEGISATDTKKRDGFKQMIADALAGKIDLIITKSVSRFARNTVDSLTTVRKLKEKGIEVCFEKENIYTLDSKGELLFTIMSSLAQEESRSISENTTWGKRKQFADGKGSLAYSTFLGYEKGEDGSLRVDPEQAETVKLIYQLFLQGLSPYAIGKKLTGLGIKSPAGKDTWHQSSVKSILTNEKYKGDALLQKQYRRTSLRRNGKRTRGKFRSIMWRGATRRSSLPKYGSWCRRRWSGGKAWTQGTAARAYFPQKSNAPSAGTGTAPRYGTRRTNTAG